MTGNGIMNYRIIDKDRYYRKGVFRHFTEDAKCSMSMTARVDVTDLVRSSKERGKRFYLDFLYILTKVLNSREDYRMGYLWQTDELICYDTINPTQYVFHEDTETCTPVYSTYYEDYDMFYENAQKDLEKAKMTGEYLLDAEAHHNWFDASYISWLSYDSLFCPNSELGKIQRGRRKTHDARYGQAEPCHSRRISDCERVQASRTGDEAFLQ